MEIGSTVAVEDKMDNSPGVDYFNSLPDELIVMIFRHLPPKDKVKQLARCGGVCRRWQRITQDESLWIDTVLSFQTIPLLNVAKFIQRGIRNLDLVLAKISDPDPWRRCFPKKYKSKLEVLNISSLTISKRGFAHLLGPCRNLVHLNASGAFVNRLACETIGRNAQLESLTLSDAQGLDAPGLTAVLKGCQNLKRLYLSSTNLSQAALTAMTSNLSPSLTTLSISNCYNVEDQHVFDLVDRCPNLRFLDLAGNPNLTEAACQKAYTIKDLELVFDPSIFDDDYTTDDDDMLNFDFDDEDDDDFTDEEDYDDFFLDDSLEDDDDDFFFDPLEGLPGGDDQINGDLLQPMNVDEEDAEEEDDDDEEEDIVFGSDSEEEVSRDGDSEYDDQSSYGSNEDASSSDESENSNEDSNGNDPGDDDDQSSGSDDKSEDVVDHIETETEDSDVDDDDDYNGAGDHDDQSSGSDDEREDVFVHLGTEPESSDSDDDDDDYLLGQVRTFNANQPPLGRTVGSDRRVPEDVPVSSAVSEPKKHDTNGSGVSHSAAAPRSGEPKK